MKKINGFHEIKSSVPPPPSSNPIRICLPRALPPRILSPAEKAMIDEMARLHEAAKQKTLSLIFIKSSVIVAVIIGLIAFIICISPS
jgi:hypothetical protein